MLGALHGPLLSLAAINERERTDSPSPPPSTLPRPAAELSKWVLSDSEGGGLLPSPQQAQLAVGLRAMPQEGCAAVLSAAAVTLAQQVA